MTQRRVAVLHQGRALELGLGARLVAGRDPGCELTLPAPAAPRHLAFEHRLAGASVEVLAAPAWTVDAAALAPGQRRALSGGELALALGPLRLVLRVSAPEPPAAPPELPGLRLVRKLGQGGSGEVWEGTLLATGEAVAVKLLHADPVGEQRARREARLKEHLLHPGIARVIDLFCARGRTVLVRELVPGPTLGEVLRTRGRLPWPEAARLAVLVARALSHAHARGVVHRDVKPENVVLAPDGQPRLIDFDLARLLDPAAALTRLTASGEGLGSLGYLAPEQLDRAHAADARADVFGLGATLLHALSGQRPHQALEPEELLQALRRGPPPARSLVPDLPPALAEVVDRACAADPAARWGDAASLAVALAGLLPP